ncbi:MAG: ATP-binding cassette domain-containing protein [Oscillospiraceae bacterium]|nr:ATP-binding cassette domain-containing protein [Oscillospiraceae bacterium]
MIVCNGLCKSFEGKAVLRGFSCRLPDSGVVCLLAPSGGGKTTLLHILAGLTAPDSGTVEGLEGRRVSMVFQENRLLPWLTAGDNIALVQEKGAEATPPARWMAAAGLAGEEKKRPGELSGGMKRRVAILRALAYIEQESRAVLLLDEPFKGLDREARGVMMELTAQRAEKGDLVLLVTHDPEEAAALADWVLLCGAEPFRILAEQRLERPRAQRDAIWMDKARRLLTEQP